MGWTDNDSVRLLSGITEAEISTATLTDLISFASVTITKDVTIEVRDELILSTRDASGSTTFTCRYRFFGDDNYDNTIDATDVVCFDGRWDDGDKISLTIASVVDGFGQIVLESAPSGSVYASYRGALLPMSHTLIELATIYLAASMCYDRLRAGAKKIKIADFYTEYRNLWFERYQQTKADVLSSAMIAVKKRKSMMQSFGCHGDHLGD